VTPSLEVFPPKIVVFYDFLFNLEANPRFRSNTTYDSLNRVKSMNRRLSVAD
jgi:hypothetical protein